MKLLLAFVLILSSGMAGCAYFSQGKPVHSESSAVSRVIPDARAAAAQLSQSLLSGAWLSDFYQEKRRSPVLMLGSLSGNPKWEAELDLFVKSMTWQLLQSQQLRIVCYRDGCEVDRFLDYAPLSAEAQKMGADFMLASSVTEGHGGLIHIDLQVLNLNGIPLMNLNMEFKPSMQGDGDIL